LDADDRAKRLTRAGGDIDHEQRLWRRVYPPTGREGLPPLAFVFADTTPTKVANTVKVLEEAGRRYWHGTRYDPRIWKGVTARDYNQAVPVLVTTLEELREDGAGTAMWRRLGRGKQQKLTQALDNPDSDTLFRRQAARAQAEGERQRAADREARRPVCTRCGATFTDERWQETEARSGSWKAGDLSVCGACHADDVAREKAAAAVSGEATLAHPGLMADRDPEEQGKRRGLFRRRS
jgi:hypothetical protein